MVPTISLSTDLDLFVKVKPMATTAAKAASVTRVVDEWRVNPCSLLTMGMVMSQTIKAVGNIHLLLFQNAAPQKRSAAIGVKFGSSE